LGLQQPTLRLHTISVFDYVFSTSTFVFAFVMPRTNGFFRIRNDRIASVKSESKSCGTRHLESERASVSVKHKTLPSSVQQGC